jgi:hypothetical protein
MKDEQQLELGHGKPMLFGKNKKNDRSNSMSMPFEVVTTGENGVSADDILVHDETNRMLAVLLCQLEPPDFPVPIGVLYCNPAKPYEDAVWAQVCRRQGEAQGQARGSQRDPAPECPVDGRCAVPRLIGAQNRRRLSGSPQ